MVQFSFFWKENCTIRKVAHVLKSIKVLVLTPPQTTSIWNLADILQGHHSTNSN